MSGILRIISTISNQKRSGVSQIAAICGVTPQAVKKWVVAGRLPRTEFTGETNHAEKICRAYPGLVTASELKAGYPSSQKEV